MGGFVVAFICLCLLVCYPSIGTKKITSTKEKGLVLKLVHLQIPSTHTEELEDPVLPIYRTTASRPMAMVSFGLGDPLVPQLAIMDTGSKRIWVQCYSSGSPPPSGKKGPLYDPVSSETWNHILCGTSDCPSDSICRSEHSLCWFTNFYGSGTLTGFLSEDKFTFGTDLETPTDEVLTFGCVDPALKFYLGDDKRVDGVFGLADHDFLTLLGPKFSYCIGDLLDPYDTSSSLRLGPTARMDGGRTTLLVDRTDGHFVLAAKSIFFGDEDLKIGPQYINIDSGSKFTRFVRELFDKVETQTRDAMKRLGFEYFRDDTHYSAHCYKGSVKKVDMFPALKLQFGPNNAMELKAIHLFYQHSRTQFCFSVRRSYSGTNILGIPSQQGFNLGFDTDDKIFTFLSVSCKDYDKY